VSSTRCNRRNTSSESGVSALRPRQPHGRRTRVGSILSAFRRSRSAKASLGRWSALFGLCRDGYCSLLSRCSTDFLSSSSMARLRYRAREPILCGVDCVNPSRAAALHSCAHLSSRSRSLGLSASSSARAHSLARSSYNLVTDGALPDTASLLLDAMEIKSPAGRSNGLRPAGFRRQSPAGFRR
jgi:hypothetical protein